MSKGISLERVPCRFGSLALGCCPSMLLQSECENCAACENFLLKKFAKLKTHENLVLGTSLSGIITSWSEDGVSLTWVPQRLATVPCMWATLTLRKAATKVVIPRRAKRLRIGH